MATCEAITNPNTVWPPMCPNIAAAYFYAVLFGLVFITHIVQMFWSRKPYCWVICVSAGMQTAAYILRVLSIQHVTNANYYTYWFILMMVSQVLQQSVLWRVTSRSPTLLPQIAPIWTNAFAYMVMGRMVYNFTHTASVFKLPAWHFGLLFVLLDVFAFLVQAAGASMASGGASVKLAMLGIHVYMGGIGFQQLCIFAFLALATRLHLHLRRQSADTEERRTAFRLLYVEYAVVILITVRIIFRLIEYSSGINSSIPQHEVYQYVFDSTLMLFALVAFNVFHPGFMMPGNEANMPKRKARKALKRQGQTVSGRAAEYVALDEPKGVASQEGPDDVEQGYDYDGHGSDEEMIAGEEARS